ncbi:MAG: hypothetical protein V7721_01785 [Porticoccaceae bacterium]
MNNTKKIICSCLVSLFSWNSWVFADDIDIYLGAKPDSAALVMLMLDYRPSVFSTMCTSTDDCFEILGGTIETDVPVLDADGNPVLDADGNPVTETVVTKGDVQIALEAARTAASIPFSDNVTTYEVFVAVLEVVLSNPSYDTIHMGLMLSNKTNGGTILDGYKELGATISADIQSATGLAATTQNKTYLIDRLREITKPGNASSASLMQPSETYFELYSYLNGLSVQFGDTAGTADNFVNGGGVEEVNIRDFDEFISTTAGAPGGDYIEPQQYTDFTCTSMYSIAMATVVDNSDDDLDAEITSNMSADAAVDFTGMLNYMSDTDLVTGAAGDQNMLTWIISDGSVGKTRTWAAAGGTGDGVIDLTDPGKLQNSLDAALTEVVSVSSTFVAASVPVNVFNRTESLDNLYIALFEANSTIDWVGNLKKLKLKDLDINKDSTGDGIPDTTDGFFDTAVDVNNLEAFEIDGENIGRIKTEALTFWTDKDSLPTPDAEKGEIAEKDGRSITRGGAGQKIPGFISGSPGDQNSDTDARQVYVSPVSGTALEALDVFGNTPSAAEKTVIEEMLGVTYNALSNPDKGRARTATNETIQWLRGIDVDDVDGDPTTTVKPWIMAASIHSRPLAINYGTRGGYSTTNPNIVLMMGTNDGFFHFYQNTTTGGAESGAEQLAFMPREMLNKAVDFRANTQVATKMIYGVDGEPASLVVDDNRDGTIDVGDEVYVYFGFRRGGNGYYALDVSNPSVASTPPTIAWKIFQTSGGNFDELGLTFSKPVATKVNYNGTITDVIVFAGGYNGGWNSTFTARLGKDLGDADDTVGNAIYVVNARTGALIWKVKQGSGAATNTVFQHADMVDSIPATVVTLDVNNNGVTDRMYVGDTGGAVWRVDMPEGSAANQRQDSWFASKFAELGTDGAATDRRFFHSVDIVLTKDDTGDYDGIAISSGDRAHPKETDVSNYLFYMKDRTTTSGAASVRTRTPYVLSDLADVTSCLTGAEFGCAALSMANGWKIEMEGTGEKSLSKPLIDGGLAVFTSFEPSIVLSSCDATEGEGFVYLVNLSDGTSYYADRKFDVGKGIPSGVVAINGALIIPGGGIIIPGQDANNDGKDDREKIVASTSKGSWLIYWREPGIDDL